MTNIPSIRGMPDLLPDVVRTHDHIITTAQKLANLYGFEKIQTTLLEPIEVFKRTVGETADIVSKEMYTLFDRNDKELCLRPEGTASVMRAILHNKLTQSLPLKYFYAGPMFRYERPQKGRLRQFTQIGTEHIGDASVYADIEVIALGWKILNQLGLNNICLEINSLGDQASRAAHLDVLVEYYQQHKASLSADSLNRLEKNPLRILDSKAPEDQEINVNAPKISDYLSEEARVFFQGLCEGLTALNIPYTVNPTLVRGLDYYCHTTFEFKVADLGAQSTVMAGGRYDGLSRMLGGPEIPGIGWAAGVDRIALLLDDIAAATPDVMVVPIGDAALIEALKIGDDLRMEGLKTFVSYKPSLKHGLKKADKLQMKYVILLGTDELAAQNVQVRNLQTSKQETVSRSNLQEYMKTLP